jgi:hypothetical protein
VWSFAALFLAVNTLLSAYYLDSVPSPNPTSRVLPVLTFYEEGTYAIDKYQKLTMDKSFINGHYYSDKAPLSTWIVLPLYGLLRLVYHPDLQPGQAGWLPVALIGDIACGTIPFVLLLWLVVRRAGREAPDANPVVLCMLPLYGSFVFAYSGVFMSHLLSGIFLCASYILLKRETHPLWCGLLLGMSVLAEFPTALAVPIWAVSMARTRREHLRWFVLGGLPCLTALLLYNHAITGSVRKMPYDFVADSAFSDMRSAYGMHLPQPEAVWGLLFSTYRGMFFYAPALAIVALAYARARRLDILRQDLVTPLGLLAICYLGLVSSYFVWWGGWAYGPRHLIPLAMLLFYEGLPPMARTLTLRRWLHLLSLFGLFMVWISKATALYLLPEQFTNPVFEVSLPSFLHGQLRHDSVLTHLFHLDPAIAAWLWLGSFAAGTAGLHQAYSRTFLRQRGQVWLPPGGGRNKQHQ